MLNNNEHLPIFKYILSDEVLIIYLFIWNFINLIYSIQTFKLIVD